MSALTRCYGRPIGGDLPTPNNYFRVRCFDPPRDEIVSFNDRDVADTQGAYVDALDLAEWVEKRIVVWRKPELPGAWRHREVVGVSAGGEA